ncbi:MurR/RpiR family transcriptional regulator [Castellaniella sp. GW247-6E4]|uniref:MurR/RpiR family transcriptional regulator n=1 Tax=Castellaniella sp. GW247-6E4 TaxID=3140380 RepID=UPI003314EF64
MAKKALRNTTTDEDARGAGNVETLLQTISAEYPNLSRQLAKIAVFIERNHEYVGLYKIKDIAERCDVQPSAIIRFAHHFGFKGFSEMQAVFKARLSRRVELENPYRDRIRQVIGTRQTVFGSDEIIQQSTQRSIEELVSLGSEPSLKEIDAVVDRLIGSDKIWIAGMRRSYPVASYLTYALQHIRSDAVQITNTGGMYRSQIRRMAKDDILLLFSYEPYAEETLDIARFAAEQGVAIVAITDSQMSPYAQLAAHLILIKERPTLGFRSLVSSMALAHSIFVAFAYKAELAGEGDSAS